MPTELTPIDPMADDVVTGLYGKILLIAIPLLTLGGMILGYLIMTSRTTGESAYTARAVTPRFRQRSNPRRSSASSSPLGSRPASAPPS